MASPDRDNAARQVTVPRTIFAAGTIETMEASERRDLERRAGAAREAGREEEALRLYENPVGSHREQRGGEGSTLVGRNGALETSIFVGYRHLGSSYSGTLFISHGPANVPCVLLSFD